VSPKTDEIITFFRDVAKFSLSGKENYLKKTLSDKMKKKEKKKDDIKTKKKSLPPPPLLNFILIPSKFIFIFYFLFLEKRHFI